MTKYPEGAIKQEQHKQDDPLELIMTMNIDAGFKRGRLVQNIMARAWTSSTQSDAI